MSKTPDEHRVVITGVGAVTNVGHDASSTWDAFVRGVSGVRTIDDPRFADWSDEHWAVKISGAIADFTGAPRLDSRDAKRLDRFAILGTCAGMEAIEDSGIDFEKEDAERCGVIVGSGVGGIITIEDGVNILRSKGPKRMSPFTVPRLMANAVSGELSIRYGLKGHTGSHTTACASSGHSIAEAFDLVRKGRMDVMIAGGAEGSVSPLCLGAFQAMRALSTRNDEPEKASRPFDKDRDGFVLSEGSGVVILESLAHAKKRGARIYAELLGAGVSSDASHITAPDPEGRGAMRAMRWALEEAKLNPGDVDYINAHGTSTPLGDSAEVAAAMTLFGDHARKSAGGKLMMSSTKSMTGHFLGASGAVELLACLGAIEHNLVPPTINLENPDEGFDIDLVPHSARESKVKVAMNNTFGFGGHNVSLVVAGVD